MTNLRHNNVNILPELMRWRHIASKTVDFLLTKESDERKKQQEKEGKKGK
jgi:hypothetical protein